MKMKTIKLTLILLTFGITVSISAQTSVNDSLWQYMKIAIQNNPGILAKADEYKAALYKIPQVSSLPDPELSISLFLTPMEIVSGKQVADLQLMQMLPWFGTLKYAHDEMSLMAKARYESLQDAKLQLLYDVQSSWYDLYRTHRNLKLTEKNLAILEQIEELALLKFKTYGSTSIQATTPIPMSETKVTVQSQVGMGGMQGSNTMKSSGSISRSGAMTEMPGGNETGLSSIYRLQMEKYDLLDNIATLRESIISGQSEFNALLNRPATATVFFPDSMNVDMPEFVLLSLSPDSFFTGQPMLEMIKYESESLRAKSKMVEKMGYPMLGVGIGYSAIAMNANSTSAMNGMDMLMPMIKVSIPIYRKKYNAMKSETEMLRSATQNNLMETQNLLYTRYIDAVERYNNARRQTKLYNTQITLLQKILDISIIEFSNSGSGLIELLRTRQELFSYELKKEESIAGINASVAYLRRITGRYNTEEVFTTNIYNK